eukprot:6165448-Amphidinium_carterae.1
MRTEVRGIRHQQSFAKTLIPAMIFNAGSTLRDLLIFFCASLLFLPPRLPCTKLCRVDEKPVLANKSTGLFPRNKSPLHSTKTFCASAL